MANNNTMVGWAMRYHKIIFLVTALLLIAGIFGLVYMPKQEYPSYTILQGVVVGIYPGANSQQVAEQLTKPLEEHLFKYKEVKRKDTYSQSRDGVVYIYVTLNDDIKNKEEVWSKIRHGLNELKQSLSPEIAAITVDSDFGETSSLLFSIESETKTYRQLEDYLKSIEERLRKIQAVSILTKYGLQNEQIAIYLDKEKMALYAIQTEEIVNNLYSQGLISYAGDTKNKEVSIPIYLSTTYKTEQNIANQIIRGDEQGNILRIKDIANIVREYPSPDSYIQNNGTKCLLMSVEMEVGNDVTKFGKELNSILAEEKSKLPNDVVVNTIVDQSKVVTESVNSFLLEMLMAIISVILVTLILMPFRVAGVAATSIPITIFLSLGIMYVAGFELNMVTFAALIVVLGLIVDDCIVIVDGYIDNIDRGISRWHASIMSAQEYFKSLISATLAISITFFPFLLTFKGELKDFVFSFPWTVTITLLVSLAVAIVIIPFIQYTLIRKGLHNNKKISKVSILDRIQSGYNNLLPKLFKYPVIPMSVLVSSIVLTFVLFAHSSTRLMPMAERDLFAVEIYLPQGSSLGKTANVCDSMRNILARDERVLSVTSFTGTSSPRFNSGYSPNMPSKNYGQFIVNTKSNKATEDVLDEYTNKYAYYFPGAYIYFKQMDNESVRFPIEVRLSESDERTLKKMSEELIKELTKLEELVWIQTDSENSLPAINIDINSLDANRQGIDNSSVARELISQHKGMDVTSVWEKDYKLNVKLKGGIDDDKLNNIKDIYVPTALGTPIPLRQIGKVSADWREGQINHRNGVLTVSVRADLKRGINANNVFEKVSKKVDLIKNKAEYSGVNIEYGGLAGSDNETIPRIINALLIAIFIIYFILVFHYKKISLANLTLASTILCFFGAAFGIWITGSEFGFTSVLGIVCLLGIVVRNGIILFDHAEHLRKIEKLSVKEAAIESAKRRMRPIILTSTAASVGVITMLVSGSPLWAPMGAVICFGALFSMVFILTILPVAYWLVYKRTDFKMKNKKAFIILFTLFVSISISAQETYNLYQCKELAKKNNITLKIDHLSVEEANQLKKETVTNFFPKISANGMGYYTRDGLLGKDFSTMLGLPNMKKGYLTEITVEQPIFVGGQIYYGNKLAKTGEEISRYQLAESEKNIILAVEQYYWSLISLYEKRKTINIIDNLTVSLYKDVKVAVEAGVTNRNDLLKVELKQNEIKNSSLELENAIKLIKMQLAQIIGMSDTNFKIEENIIKELIDPQIFWTNHNQAFLNTNSFHLLNKNIELNQLKLKMKLGEYLPSVGVGASYSYSNIFSNRSYSSTMFYVSVSVPISDWWGGSHAIKQKKNLVRIAEYTKKDSEQKLLLQMQKYCNMLDEAYNKALLARQAIETAQENVRLNTDSYKVGVSIISDLIDAQSLLQQSRDKYTEAYTDYLICQSIYLKETGR